MTATRGRPLPAAGAEAPAREEGARKAWAGAGTPCRRARSINPVTTRGRRATDCQWGECDPEGKNTAYYATCQVGGHWKVTVDACDPVCCAADAECKSGRCAEGQCLREPLLTSSCAADSDCASDEFCFGAEVCPCDKYCNYTYHLGRCLPAGIGCCTGDADCGAGERCTWGVCRVTQPGECWSMWTCAFVCDGGHFCMCGDETCTDAKPGLCITG